MNSIEIDATLASGSSSGSPFLCSFRFSVRVLLFSVSRKQERTRASLSRSQKEKGKHCSRTVSRFPGDDVPGNHSWNQLRNSGGQCKLLRGASVGLSASASSLTPSCSYAEPAYLRLHETCFRWTEMGAIRLEGNRISGCDHIRERFEDFTRRIEAKYRFILILSLVATTSRRDFHIRNVKLRGND